MKSGGTKHGGLWRSNYRGPLVSAGVVDRINFQRWQRWEWWNSRMLHSSPLSNNRNYSLVNASYMPGPMLSTSLRLSDSPKLTHLETSRASFPTWIISKSMFIITTVQPPRVREHEWENMSECLYRGIGLQHSWTIPVAQCLLNYPLHSWWR